MESLDFVGHIIYSGKKRIINVPASRFKQLDKLLEELKITDLKELYFKIHLEPIILKKA